MSTTFGRVHFIGIGGVGMSAIAKVLIERGVRVTGSDLKRSGVLTTLEAVGAQVSIGHRAEAVEGADLVVVSSAIPPDNPELVAARDAGIQVASRGEALASVLEGTDAVIVAGTHGKTSTTSMAVSIFRAAEMDPTYLVGGGLNDAGTNARFGRGRFSIAEADESDGSFLLLRPTVGVVTNVEVDHVDYWSSLESLHEAFSTFMAAVTEGGAIVVPSTDERLIATARQTGRRVITFGEGGDVAGHDPQPVQGGIEFDLVATGSSARVALRVPGRHNVANALAAGAAALAADISVDQIAAGLASYRGVERRFQIRGSAAGVVIVDDYAHHPTEVAATLSTAATQAGNRVLAVFQPHRYSRTAAFAERFGASFAHADVVVVTDVYGAGEAPVPGVSGKLIADAVCEKFPGRPVAYLPHRDELIAYLTRTARPGDLLLTMGAGDVTSVGEELLGRLGRTE